MIDCATKRRSTRDNPDPALSCARCRFDRRGADGLGDDAVNAVGSFLDVGTRKPLLRPEW